MVGRLMLSEHIVEFFIVFDTAQFEDAVCLVNLPVGAGTFQPHLTDELVCGFNCTVGKTGTLPNISSREEILMDNGDIQ